MESVSTAASMTGRLDAARAAASRSGNTRLDKVIDVLDIIYNYFKNIWDRGRYENFHEYFTSSKSDAVRGSKTEYYQNKLNRDIQAVYGRIRKGGYSIGNED